jgi:hypothetical protein
VFFAAAMTHAGEFINPYAGRQERADTFEFAEKPAVEKKGDGYVIRFAAKAPCDATVMIVASSGSEQDPEREKIVRHLASGVLGKNAPWPFKQGVLEQELLWDGKDDRGKPVVDVSTCKAKVGLGLQARLANILGWAPGEAQGPDAFVVGPDGHAYILDNDRATCCQPSSNIRVFDHECRYLRKIMPPMASVPPEKSNLLKWNRTTWGAHVPQRANGHYAITLGSYGVGPGVVTTDGRLLWVACKWRGRGHGRTTDAFLISIDVRDGAAPAGSIVNIDPACKIMGVGTMNMALSPDGRWLYVASPIFRNRPIRHAVFRMDMKKPGPVSVFLGKPTKAGSDNAHFNKPVGVACDGDGNLYVSDRGNNRIGAYGNADCRGKDSPVPDPKTGELRPRREGDPEDLKSPLAKPDIAFIDPTYTAVTDEAVYVLDRSNARIVRAVLEYETEEEIALP